MNFNVRNAISKLAQEAAGIAAGFNKNERAILAALLLMEYTRTLDAVDRNAEGFVRRSKRLIVKRILIAYLLFIAGNLPSDGSTTDDEP